MSLSRRFLFAVIVSLSAGTTVRAQVANKGYSTRLFLDPVAEGPGQTITGGGAPDTSAIFVELWRVPFGSSKAESVASVPTIAGAAGQFSFSGVDVQPGDSYFVTLSRSWQFDTDGDLEGWDNRISPDARLEVSGGVLRVTVENNTGLLDPFFFNNFLYDSHYYRVVEIRLRNPAPVSTSKLGVFFGDPWTAYENLHNAVIPSGMTEFETFLIPMNVDETRVKPGPVERHLDGLWDTGRMNDVIRLDPLNGVPADERSLADGTVFEIDYIRIREDYRLEFDHDGDWMGLDNLIDVQQPAVADGFLVYTSGQSPAFFSSIATGMLESGYFSRFVIGMDNPTVANGANAVGLSYLDATNTLTTVAFSMPLLGRQDAAVDVDSLTVPAGEWTGQVRVPVEGLELAVPMSALAGDQIRIDYFGFVPADPYGPSDPVHLALPNNPPVAVITTDPASAEVELTEGGAEIVLDGSGSDDGDGGTQALTFLWRRVSGPEGNSIDPPDEAVTLVTFSQPGEYVYELTVNDGQLANSEASAQITVLVTERVSDPVNMFLRGDPNSNGTAMEVADAMHVLNFLFRQRKTGVVLTCPDAADLDDDGAVNITDAIQMLRFHRGETPPPDFGLACGPDVNEDALPECDYPEDACVSPALATLGIDDLGSAKDKKRARKRIKRAGNLVKKICKFDKKRAKKDRTKRDKTKRSK